MKPAPPVTSARMAAHRSGRLLDCAGWAAPFADLRLRHLRRPAPRLGRRRPPGRPDGRDVARLGRPGGGLGRLRPRGRALDVGLPARAWREFRRWASSVPHLVNPPAVLEWNTDKRYLAEAQAAGLPVVPTRFVAPGDPWATAAGGALRRQAGRLGGRAGHARPADRRGGPRGGAGGVDPRFRAHRDGPAARRLGRRARRARALLLRRRLLPRDRQGRGARGGRGGPARPRDAPGGVAGRRDGGRAGAGRARRGLAGRALRGGARLRAGRPRARRRRRAAAARARAHRAVPVLPRTRPTGPRSASPRCWRDRPRPAPDHAPEPPRRAHAPS